MTNETPAAALLSAAGWYAAPDRPGQSRYWDGNAWTEHYASPLAAQSFELRKAPNSGLGCFSLFGIIILAGILVFGGAWAFNTWVAPDNEASEPWEVDEPVVDELVVPAAPVKTPADRMDELMTGAGFQIGEAGNIYYQPMPEGTFTCGAYDCIGYSVMAVNGCAGGVYFAASIETDDGISVGMANEITAALTKGQTATVLLEDYSGNGTKFRATDARCMG